MPFLGVRLRMEGQRFVDSGKGVLPIYLELEVLASSHGFRNLA